MKNKNGFISMSLVYSFLVIFLFLMAAIINCFLKKNTYLEALDNQVAQDIGITQDAKASIFTTILEDNVALQTTSLNYTKIANNTARNGNGLFYVESSDDTDENNDGYGSKIYFFRGEVDNNNVIFGSKVTRDASGKVSKTEDMCWKIIRTNEDGSLRMIYNGLANSGKCDGTTPYISTSVYNILNTDNAYVGYSYGDYGVVVEEGMTDYDAYMQTHYHSNGTVVSSTIRGVLDNFFLYDTNFYYYPSLSYQPSSSTDENETITMVNDKIANAIYCNNRTMYTSEEIIPSIALASAEDTKLGYATNVTIYKGYDSANGNPSFVCNQSIDKYNLRVISGGTNENYNALYYAVGLPTVDDVIFAGGAYNTANNKYYLYTGSAYWTMTPSSFSNSLAQVFTVETDGSVIEKSVNEGTYGVRPVISIDSKTLVKSGSGLKTEPYILK